MEINREIVVSARKNSAYATLRIVVRWLIVLPLYSCVLVFLWGGFQLGDTVVEPSFNSLYAAASASRYSVSEIEVRYKADHKKLELPQTFTAAQLEAAYDQKLVELRARERELNQEVATARRNRDQVDLNAAVAAINVGRIEMQAVIDAKFHLGKFIDEKVAQKEKEIVTKVEQLKVGYYSIITIVTLIFAAIVTAIHQALTCVIDIADCQVEIYVRTVNPPKPEAETTFSTLKYGG